MICFRYEHLFLLKYIVINVIKYNDEDVEEIALRDIHRYDIHEIIIRL
jgi:hypothetical protein